MGLIHPPEPQTQAAGGRHGKTFTATERESNRTRAGQQAATLKEAHRIYRREIAHDPFYAWADALVWAHRKISGKRKTIAAQMQAIAAGVRAHSVDFGGYGRR